MYWKYQMSSYYNVFNHPVMHHKLTHFWRLCFIKCNIKINFIKVRCILNHPTPLGPHITEGKINILITWSLTHAKMRFNRNDASATSWKYLRLITPICKSINSSTSMYNLQLPFVPPTANADQVSFLMCWIWQGWLMYWERHTTWKTKLFQVGRRKKVL